MTDIEISRNSHKRNIVDVAKTIGIKKNDLELYGNYKAKILTANPRKKQGKLILVTAISPTPMGEGKTTVSIGLGDALSSLGVKKATGTRDSIQVNMLYNNLYQKEIGTIRYNK